MIAEAVSPQMTTQIETQICADQIRLICANLRKSALSA
jgi:hypothetical protein